MYQYDDLPETAHQTGVAHLPNRSQILLWSDATVQGTSLCPAPAKDPVKI
jgi:hypothetical protein